MRLFQKKRDAQELMEHRSFDIWKNQVDMAHDVRILTEVVCRHLGANPVTGAPRNNITAFGTQQDPFASHQRAHSSQGQSAQPIRIQKRHALRRPALFRKALQHGSVWKPGQIAEADKAKRKDCRATERPRAEQTPKRCSDNCCRLASSQKNKRRSAGYASTPKPHKQTHKPQTVRLRKIESQPQCSPPSQAKNSTGGGKGQVRNDTEAG